MTEAFIAFVRFEEKLLLLSRSKDDNSQDSGMVFGALETLQKKSSIAYLKQQVFLLTHSNTSELGQNAVSIWVETSSM